MSTKTAEHHRNWPIYLLLAAAVLILYAQVYRFEFLSYDDTEYVSKDPNIYNGLTFEGLREVFLHGHVVLWNPITSLSYMLGCQIYGLNAGAHHLTNIPLHLANVLLLFWILRRWTGQRWASAIVAALFAVHPLNVEPVAWVSGRKELLYTFFWLLAMDAHGRYAKGPGVGRYLWLSACFVLGMASKASLLTLPCALLLLDYWPLRRCCLDDLKSWDGRIKLCKLVLEKVPLMGIAVAATLFNMSMLKGDTARTLEAVSFADRIVNTGVVYLRYLGKAFWPQDLSAHYPYPVEAYPLWLALAGYALLGAVSLIALWRIRQAPYLFVGWFWFLGTMVPVIGLVRVGSFIMADRYGYVPFIGLFIAVVWAGAAVVTKRPSAKPVLATVTAAYLLGFAVFSDLQARHWENDLTLWGQAVRATPDSPIAWNSMGTALRRAGRNDEAIEHFMKALEVPGPYKVNPHMNLGNLLAEMERYDEAAAHYEDVIQNNPGFAPAHLLLGKLLADQNRKQEAISQYTQVLALNSDNADALEALGKLQEGDADLVAGHNALGKAYFALGLPDAASHHYTQALECDPKRAETHNNLGVAHATAGRFDEAIVHFNQVLEAQPGNVDALTNLGTIMAMRGKPKEAAQQFEKVLEINPNHLGARGNLAQAYMELGEREKAVQQFEAILKVQPDHPGAKAALQSMNQPPSP